MSRFIGLGLIALMPLNVWAGEGTDGTDGTDETTSVVESRAKSRLAFIWEMRREAKRAGQDSGDVLQARVALQFPFVYRRVMDRYAVDGVIDWENFPWDEFFELIDRILGFLLQIIGDDVTLNSALPPGPSVQLGKHAQAAADFTDAIRTRLAENFNETLRQYRLGMDNETLNRNLNQDMANAWHESMNEFGVVVGGVLRDADKQGIERVLGEFVKGFDQ